jgi:bifunctional non-homologous end joining protein LigD
MGLNSESAGSLKAVSLYYRQGTSDKVYQAWIERVNGGYAVNCAYGRRGSALTTATKTRTPVDYDGAVYVLNKVVSEKTAKGYTTAAQGTPYQHGSKAGQVSGLLPQLLNPIDNSDAPRFLADPGWALQEKLDGRRLLLRSVASQIEGVNKLGLVIGVACPIIEEARTLGADFVLDGEVIGDRLHVFDLLSRDGSDLRPLPWAARYQALTAMLGTRRNGHVQVVDCWTDPAEKADRLAELRAARAEGVVFKSVAAPYVPGRPNSGGAQLKWKFVATLSAQVMAVNRQRSVAVSLRDGDEWRTVGNVTVPPNREVPAPGDVVEVRYLYATSGGVLYQPVYLGTRDDVEAAECIWGQLKFKGR